MVQHLLRSLPDAGDNYLIVFKLIHDLCQGEVCLSQADLSLLAKQLERSEEKGVAEEEGAATAEDGGEKGNSWGRVMGGKEGE